MEYSNEILFKVFTTYAGCEMILEKSGRIAKLCGVAFDGMIISLDDGEDMRNYEYFPFKPILTPLSAITDEHAIEVGKIVNKEIDYDGEPAIADMAGYSAAIKGVHVGDAGERLFIASKGGGRLVIFTVTRHDDIIPAANTNGIVDYLRSQGYDCGYGDIPSLIEAGLAIDKTTLNN